MAWTSDDIPDQSGRVAVITGASSGLGFEAGRELARKGAAVVMAVRDMDKGEAAASRIRAAVPDAELELQQLDLGSLDSVRECAARIAHEHDHIDILLNNAGLMATPAGQTADGFELQVGTNHLGHFVLTHELMPLLEAADGARVVTVTSVARVQGRSLSVERTQLGEAYDP
ncbi:MAG: SDR family NAD(P)-dependent oxidoreductase, partial [Candidatus Limnocylindrales bacterium]